MTSPDPSERPNVGRTVAEKYRLVRVLGAGGMGTVYEAEHTWTTRRVALKLLRSEYSADPIVVQRFLDEAKSAAQVAHPNIVEVLDMGRDPADGALYLVQELMTGGDLRGMLDARGKLPLREALDTIVPIMAAVLAAEQRGIVHRDIKPENIFLARTASGGVEPKLIDFGISKRTTRKKGDVSLTTEGTTLGTPQYMSPEQARGDADIDTRGDVWSVGVVLFEMLSGRCPYESDRPNLLLMKIVSELPPRIETFVPDLPPGFGDVLHRALAHDRSQRYQSMHAFLAAVLDYDARHLAKKGLAPLSSRHADSLRVFAEASAAERPYSLTEVRAVDATTHVRAPTPPTPAARSGRAHRREIIVVGIALMVSIVGAVIALRPSAPPPARAVTAAPAPVTAPPPAAAPAPGPALVTASDPTPSGIAPVDAARPVDPAAPHRRTPTADRRANHPRDSHGLQPATHWPGSP